MKTAASTRPRMNSDPFMPIMLLRIITQCLWGGFWPSIPGRMLVLSDSAKEATLKQGVADFHLTLSCLSGSGLPATARIEDPSPLACCSCGFRNSQLLQNCKLLKRSILTMQPFLISDSVTPRQLTCRLVGRCRSSHERFRELLTNCIPWRTASTASGNSTASDFSK